MPRYEYRCLKCSECFTIRHSIKEKREVCECGKSGVLQRVPSIPIYVEKNNAGKVVKKHIEEAREEIKEFQKDMSKGIDI